MVDDFIKALQDKCVVEIIRNQFESTLKGLTTENTKLREKLNIANYRIEELEAYSKKSDLIITGLLHKRTLDQNAANPFREARYFGKDGRINRAGTSEGVLYVKKMIGSTCRPIKIQIESALLEL